MALDTIQILGLFFILFIFNIYNLMYSRRTESFMKNLAGGLERFSEQLQPVLKWIKRVKAFFKEKEWTLPEIDPFEPDIPDEETPDVEAEDENPEEPKDEDRDDESK